MVTGANGQLGNSLRRELEADSSIEAIYTDANTLDITDYGTLNIMALLQNDVSNPSPSSLVLP